MGILRRLSFGVVVASLVACGWGGKPPAPAAGEEPRAAEQSSSRDPSGSASEAERTREMEDRAAEMNRGLEEAKASGASGADAEAAYQKFEQERAALNQAAESEPPAESAEPADQGSDYQPPPPR